jgi:hypothetical protein
MTNQDYGHEKDVSCTFNSQLIAADYGENWGL